MVIYQMISYSLDRLMICSYWSQMYLCEIFQLILDGQWEDCLEFIQPLAQLQTFDYNLFQFLILKHKFVELLCIKSEIPLANTKSAVEEEVKVILSLI